jgi:hypothetical protein
MASITKMVNNRKVVSEKVIKAIDNFGPECIPIAQQKLAEGDAGGQVPDLRGLLNACCRQLKKSVVVMEKADNDVQVEAADDPQARDNRDKCGSDLKTKCFSIRNLIAAAYGDSILSQYSLSAEIPSNPDLLTTFAKGVVTLLKAKPFTALLIEDASPLDANVLADGLLKKIEAAEKALDTIKNEERELSVVTLARTRAIENWEVWYNCTASIGAATFKLSGRDDLAMRIRPTVRKESGIIDSEIIEEEPKAEPANA